MVPVDFVMYGLLALALLTGAFIAKSRLPRKKVVIVAALLIATTLAGFYCYLFWLGPKYRPAYHVDDIVYFKGTPGNVILVQSRTAVSFRGASEGYARLSVLNAETGQRISNVLLGVPARDVLELKLQAVTDDKIWYTSYDNGLHARDPYSGEIVADAATVLAAYPQLHDRKRSTVSTADGYIFAMGPPKYELEIDSFPPNRVNSNESWMELYKRKNYWLKFRTWLKLLSKQDSSYEALWWDRNNSDMAIYDERHGFFFDDRKNTRLWFSARPFFSGWQKRDSAITPADHRLNDPFFVRNYLLRNPRSLLIGHHEIDSAYNDDFRLSRIDMKGKIVWEKTGTELGGTPNVYELHHGILYMAVEGDVVAVDTRDGTIKWTSHL